MSAGAFKPNNTVKLGVSRHFTAYRDRQTEHNYYFDYSVILSPENTINSGILEQFLNTLHVETCVLLGRESGRDVKYEYIDYVPKDNPSGNKQARYCDIKAWVEENYGFKVSSLYIGQVKDICGLAKERDLKNYGKNRVPQCPPEKVEAIKAAFKHFGMIE